MTDWVTVFLIFSSLILVPLIWIELRGEKAGDQEGSYPDPSRPLPDFHSDDPLEMGLPGAELGVFGPTRSTPQEYIDLQTVKHGWTHRDIIYYLRKFLRKKDQSSVTEERLNGERQEE